MNCCVFNDKKNSYLVAGQESHCQLYKVNTKLVEQVKVENIGNDIHIKQRNTNLKPKEQVDNNKNVKKELYYTLNPMDSVQTDFNGSEPLSRVVRINYDGKVLATGNTFII